MKLVLSLQALVVCASMIIDSDLAEAGKDKYKVLHKICIKTKTREFICQWVGGAALERLLSKGWSYVRSIEIPSPSEPVGPEEWTTPKYFDRFGRPVY